MSSTALSPSRVAIALLCAGALAFACGPRSHSEPGSAASLASASAVLLQGGPRVHNDDSRLASRIDVKLERDGVRFALRVTNETKKHIELLYPNGQTHEFVVIDSTGKEIWRWSAARLFTQSVQNKLLASGETLVKTERWEHPREHGKYTVIATLNCTNFPVQERADFVLP
jgi:hypothetical protein